MNLLIYIELFLNVFRKKFSKLESVILTSVSDGLPDEIATVFDCQCERLNIVRRDPDGVETLLYCFRAGRAVHDFCEPLSVPLGEYRLAEVNVRYYGRTVPAIVWLMDGRLFRIEFSEAIKKFDVVENYTVENLKIFLPVSR